MSTSLATVAYLGAAILFILSLGGLSNPESSRRGNLFGMIGMALAVLATVFGPHVSSTGIAWIVVALVVGGAIGLYAARVVKMTQMHFAGLDILRPGVELIHIQPGTCVQEAAIR